MGLVNFLKLSTKFFDFLAWPSFWLVYPLYASIRAVESDKHYQECLTYWVLFSITTIVEMALAKLLIWLPFWPYAKGIAILLLVAPYFGSASYVYSHFIRPYALQVNDILFTSETKVNEQNRFLDGEQRLIKETALEELIEHVIYEDDSTASFDSVKTSLTWLENPKRFQKEWSCALCLLSATSKKCLRKHMQGKKHKAMEEELRKEEAVATKTAEFSSSTNISSSIDLHDSFNHSRWVNLEKLSGLLSPVARSIRWCKWNKPKSGWTKLNTDGSMDKDNASFGGIFREHNGNPICAYVSKAPRHDIFLVELWAIWRGLVLGIGLGIRVIWVESDSLSVVNTINRKQTYGPKADSCLKQIWELLEKFETYKISHSWRETNRAADHLAKMVLSGSDIVLWPHDFPNSLCKIIKDDAQGKWHRRG